MLDTRHVSGQHSLLCQQYHNVAFCLLPMPATLQTSHAAQCNTACVYQVICIKYCQGF